MQKDKSMKQDIQERLMDGRHPEAQPFRVPDGYFDSLQSRIMEALPEGGAVVVPLHKQRRASVWGRWVAVAACTCAVVGGAIAYLGKSAPDGGKLATAQQAATASTDSYIEQVADYTMMDNDDIYTYLSSNDY